VFKTYREYPVQAGGILMTHIREACAICIAALGRPRTLGIDGGMD